MIGREAIGPKARTSPSGKFSSSRNLTTRGRLGCVTDGRREVGRHVGRIRQGGADLVGGQVVLCHDGVDGLACGKETNDRGDVHASARDAGLPESNVRIHRDSGKTSMTTSSSFAPRLAKVNRRLRWPYSLFSSVRIGNSNGFTP